MTSEETLIAQSKQGGQRAIAELVGRHYRASLQFARGFLRHTEDAQDAVQMAYILAFRQLGSFRGEASFKTWIRRIVMNCCLLQLREAYTLFEVSGLSLVEIASTLGLSVFEMTTRVFRARAGIRSSLEG